MALRDVENVITFVRKFERHIKFCTLRPIRFNVRHFRRAHKKVVD